MPEQNQQLINSLLEQQKTSSYAQNIAVESEENQLTITRVVTAKYKVYVIVLLILGVLLGTKYLPEGFQHFQAIQGQYQTKRIQLEEMKQKVAQLGKDKFQLVNLKKYEQQILACVNEQEACSELPENLKSDFWAAVAYLQMGGLSSQKMGIDEQKILRNLDQYLIKNNPADKVSTANGIIESIEIGEPELVKEDSKFYQLPITVKITFSDKDDLISFVDNIEKFIIPNEDDRILYKIEEVSYDMMAYEESQTTDILLTAYYFN